MSLSWRLLRSRGRSQNAVQRRDCFRKIGPVIYERSHHPHLEPPQRQLLCGGHLNAAQHVGKGPRLGGDVVNVGFC